MDSVKWKVLHTIITNNDNKKMKAMKLFALIAVALFFSSCASLSETDSTHTGNEDNDIRVQPEQDRDDRYGADSVQCVRNWSLYDEYYRQRNYEMAFEPWLYMFEDCPAATVNTYIHGANMMKYFFQEAETPEVQQAWVDSLMTLYDRRIEYFGERGRLLGRKAADLYQLQPDRVDELIDMTEESIELRGMQTSADVLPINMQSVIRKVEAGTMDPSEIVFRYERAMEIIEYNLENNPEEERYYRPAKNNIETMFEPYATCDALVGMFEGRYEENPEDLELLERITEMLDNSGCTDTELFYDATRSLYALQPDAESAFLMGRLELERENFESAIDFFEQSIDLYVEDSPDENQNRIFTAYRIMAETSYRQLNRMARARTYANEAHEVNPNDGRPLILIGEMYADSADQCGDNEFTKQTAYWVAVDMFQEAARAAEDPSVEDRAQELVTVYRQYFPISDDIFFHGHSEGDSYRVGCWINRNTTIRAR